MNRRAVLRGVAAGVAVGAAGWPAFAAQDWAKAKLEGSPRHREYAKVPVPGGRTVDTLVVYPERAAKAPVVVMIHEIFGLSDWAREMADELAAAGYVVVAPDLLSGMGPGGGGSSAFPSQDETIKAVSGLDPAGVQAALNAVADYGLKLPAASGSLVVMGFCWGGGKSFEFATVRPDLKAAFVFYGPPPPAEKMAAIHAPVYGFYAGDDARISATVPGTEAAMKAAGKQYASVIYPGAGHGFMRAGEAPDATAGNKSARDAAWVRVKSLMGAIG